MSKAISKRLERERAKQGIPKKDVAESLQISVQALYKKTKGIDNFTEIQIEAYAELLGLEIALLLREQE